MRLQTLQHCVTSFLALMLRFKASTGPTSAARIPSLWSCSYSSLSSNCSIVPLIPFHNPFGWLQRPRGEGTSESLQNVNVALLTIPTMTITETNKLPHATAVILEMLAYKLDTSHKGQYLPRRRRLRQRSRQRGGTLAQLSELEGSMVRKEQQSVHTCGIGDCQTKAHTPGVQK